MTHPTQLLINRGMAAPAIFPDNSSGMDKWLGFVGTYARTQI
ncbi:MAG: hypothetical protein ACLQSR_15130 [Limisphaerales bacterium]